MFDVQGLRRRLDALTPMTKADALLAVGQAESVLSVATESGDGYLWDYPGQSSREDLLGQLANIRDTIETMNLDPIPQTAREPLTAAVIEAFIKANQVAEGDETLGRAVEAIGGDLDQGLTNVGHGIGHVTGAVTGAVGEATGSALGGFFSSLIGNHPLVLLALLGGAYVFWRLERQ